MIPYNAELEQAVLGGLMTYRNLQDEVFEQASVDYFFEPKNRHVFEAAHKAYQQNGSTDLITTEATLRQLNKIDQVGVGYVTSLFKYGSTENTIHYHLSILKDLYQRRTIIQQCQLISANAIETDAEKCIDDLYKVATEIFNTNSAKRSLPADQFLQAEALKPKSERILTGERLLDNLMYNNVGLFKGQIDLTIAESGHGKTQYAMYKASKIAKQGYKVHWVQTEDYGLNTALYFKQNIPDHYHNVVITDSIFEIEEIKREVRAIKREYDTDYLVIDYVQNVECPKLSRADQVEYISRQIARMAIDMNLAIHLLSQVTIEYSKRKKWQLEPKYYDVRWSQQLKQDAHIITSIFRPYIIDDLIDGDYALDWKGDPIHKNSVFCKQAKVRAGELSHSRLHLIHTEHGLEPFAHRQDEVRQANNQWRQHPQQIDEVDF